MYQTVHLSPTPVSKATGALPSAGLLPTPAGIGSALPSVGRMVFGRIDAGTRRYWIYGTAIVVKWRHRARLRHELMTLSDRDLADLCMTRAAAQAEASKFFWQE